MRCAKRFYLFKYLPKNSPSPTSSFPLFCTLLSFEIHGFHNLKPLLLQCFWNTLERGSFYSNSLKEVNRMFKDNRYLDYNGAGFRKDLIAGITVGIVAIPLGMAFAIASGVKPEYGLYTTIIAGLLVALLGGSRFQIAGPTGAFIPILLAIVLQYGYEDLLIAGFLAGIFLVIMSFLGVSNLIHFVPRSVTIGFTTGIAVIIFTGQLGNFFGITGLEKKEFFHENMIDLVNQFHTVNVFSIVTALIGLIVIFILPKIAPRIPLLLIALLIPTLISIFLISK